MKERIKKVVSQVLKTDVDDNTHRDNCSRWDSLQQLNIIVALEEEFDVYFEPEDIAQVKSIRDIEKFLEQHS